MKRISLCVLFSAAVFVTTLPADVITAKVKSVDAAKNTMTVIFNGADQTLKVDPKAKVYMIEGRGNAAKLKEVSEGLRGLKEGTEVNLTRNEDNVVTSIQFGQYGNPAAKVKNKDKNKNNN